MRVLVTGGAGFIGQHLVHRLLLGGHEVCVLDDFSTGRRSALPPVASSAGLEVVEADVRSTITVSADACVHLACPASPIHYQRDPIRTWEVAVWGTRQVLHWADAQGARVVHASTSEVYGDPEVHPQPEEYLGRVDSQSVRGCYDEGKRAAEALCSDFRRTRDVDVRVLRIFNTYGPGMRPDDGRAIPAFAARALEGLPLDIHGSGEQTRSFCYVEDLVRGIELALLSEVEPPGPVNLGREEEVSILDLARRINRLTNNGAGVRHVAGAPADPSRRCPRLQRVQDWLGWTSLVDLDDGLARTVNALRQRPTR